MEWWNYLFGFRKVYEQDAGLLARLFPAIALMTGIRMKMGIYNDLHLEHAKPDYGEVGGYGGLHKDLVPLALVIGDHRKIAAQSWWTPENPDRHRGGFNPFLQYEVFKGSLG